MRKNEPVALVLIDPSGKMLEYSRSFHERQLEIAPLEHRDMESQGKWLTTWWSGRSIPLTRDQILTFLENAGYSGPEEYLVRNLGLSLTDYYWIKDLESDLTWEEVNLFDNAFHENVLLDQAPSEDGIPHYSPNSSLQGNIEKTWSIINGERYLIKGNHSNLSCESINEVIATRIHELQGYDNFARYQLVEIKGKPYAFGCMSKAFTSQEKELVSAWAVCTEVHRDNNTSLYEHFIKRCQVHGMDAELLRRDLEYQILIDFILSGNDRHLSNVAVLRNADTLRFERMAPIYDSGSALFVNRAVPKDLRELERMKITGFYHRESKLLKLVTEPNIVDLTKLPPASYIKEMYGKDSKLSDAYIDSIAEWYERKITMCRDLQLGKDPFGRRI